MKLKTKNYEARVLVLTSIYINVEAANEGQAVSYARTEARSRFPDEINVLTVHVDSVAEDEPEEETRA